MEERILYVPHGGKPLFYPFWISFFFSPLPPPFNWIILSSKFLFFSDFFFLFSSDLFEMEELFGLMSELGESPRGPPSPFC